MNIKNLFIKLKTFGQFGENIFVLKVVFELTFKMYVSFFRI